ncbi:hypothetical protein U9M48_033157 [Paspalum notatum var. saurae]|uniref:Uncharacterized protein n=1 Tax=Paspalum notatum var. saurae TaxID=547442 RepID=A0AAQ3X616_PASNO
MTRPPTGASRKAAVPQHHCTGPLARVQPRRPDPCGSWSPRRSVRLDLDASGSGGSRCGEPARPANASIPRHEPTTATPGPSPTNPRVVDSDRGGRWPPLFVMLRRGGVPLPSYLPGDEAEAGRPGALRVGLRATGCGVSFGRRCCSRCERSPLSLGSSLQEYSGYGFCDDGGMMV